MLLTGEFAYKIKKPVDLGFLDFTTLESRRHFCDEELRLNRRLAPDLYLDVVAIRGSAAAPTLDGDGPVLDYAVRMREFPQDALLPQVLARGALTAALVDALAAEVAAFHRRIDAAPADGAVRRAGGHPPLRGAELHPHPPAGRLSRRRAGAVAGCESWTAATYAALRPALAERRRGGFIRECHGDLHLGNIALRRRPADDLRLPRIQPRAAVDRHDERGRVPGDGPGRPRPLATGATASLSAYVEATGDYDGVAVLRFYLVYRAMVRAKVACLRALPLATGTSRAALLDECLGYVDLARRYAALRAAPW